MHVKFWGTRGSIAKPGPATARYGGNTSCVEVRDDAGTILVLDCGTGGHGLGQHLAREKAGRVDGHMLISHTHWDHIQGIPFFAPFFGAGNVWDIYGPKGLSQSLQATLAGQMEHTYFPVTLDEFAAKLRYHDLVEGAFGIGAVGVITRYLNHPALTLGFRIEADGATVAYCCDHEPHAPALASGEAALTGMDRRYADFVAGADLVIHDTQYTASEYPAKIGWGHSPVEYAVRVCRDAGVKRLALTHYDPLRVDAAVDRILEDIRERLLRDGSPLEVFGAAEGQALQLRGEGGAAARPAKEQFRANTAIDVSAVNRPVLLRLADGPSTALLSEALTMEGLPYRVVASDEELLRGVRDENPSLVLLEHQPPRIDGQKITRAVRESERPGEVQVPVVLVADAGATDLREPGAATDTLLAPFSLNYSRARIRAWVLRSACRWVRAGLPADEDRRLAALRGLAVLDTPADERFDRVTRIAAAALDVPIALVSLVDRDRQWFKSCFGLDARETSREVAFCAHAVEHKTEVVVSDTLLDERFADNPLVVAAPRIRFYAGAPLILEDGSCVGTLCVIDTRPRDFGEAERATLRDLRDLVMREMLQERA